MYKNYVIVALVTAFLVVGALFLAVSGQAPKPGVTAGGDFFNQVRFLAGAIKGTQLATSTSGNATLSGTEFAGWSNAGVVSFTPNLPTASTITFPASSSVPYVVPNAGDTTTFCVRNATSTAGVYVTLAGGTGINLVVASSSVSAVGSKVLITGKVGCITLIREAKTSSSFDIDALLTEYQ